MYMPARGPSTASLVSTQMHETVNPSDVLLLLIKEKSHIHDASLTTGSSRVRKRYRMQSWDRHVPEKHQPV